MELPRTSPSTGATGAWNVRPRVGSTSTCQPRNATANPRNNPQIHSDRPCPPVRPRAESVECIEPRPVYSCPTAVESRTSSACYNFPHVLEDASLCRGHARRCFCDGSGRSRPVRGLVRSRARAGSGRVDADVPSRGGIRHRPDRACATGVWARSSRHRHNAERVIGPGHVDAHTRRRESGYRPAGGRNRLPRTVRQPSARSAVAPPVRFASHLGASLSNPNTLLVPGAC
jgi:hypothetical protein